MHGLRKLNLWEDAAFQRLQTKNLTEDMLRTRNSGGHEFSKNHCCALISLIEQRGFLASEAIDEIDGVTSAQAKGINDGLTRDDVIGLGNSWHIAALVTFKEHHGLTADMLIMRTAHGHKFTAGHYFKLRNLVLDHKYTLRAAFDEIDEITSRSAPKVVPSAAPAAAAAAEVQCVISNKHSFRL